MEVHPEAPSEVSEGTMVDPTCNVHHVNETKQEFSLSGPNSHVELVDTVEILEDSDVEIISDDLDTAFGDPKCSVSDDSSSVGLKTLGKQDVSEQQHKITGNNDIPIKLELLHEEIDLKTEILSDLEEPTEKEAIQIKSLPCNLCNYTTPWKSNLRHHIRTTHSEEKKFKCTVCAYSSIQKYKLQRHMKIHTGEKAFSCTVCDYKFVQKSSLKRHMKIHTGEKPHACMLCEYKCIQKHTLQEHMKTHTVERFFRCTACDYKSVQKNNLQVHAKTHVEEKDKPFKCFICDYGYMSKHSLQRHMNTHIRKPL